VDFSVLYAPLTNPDPAVGPATYFLRSSTRPGPRALVRESLHGEQCESLVPPDTRGSVSVSLVADIARHIIQRIFKPKLSSQMKCHPMSLTHNMCEGHTLRT